LFGSGTARLTFVPHQNPEFAGAFNVETASYDFQAQQVDPIPEPTSMLLFGTGLAGLAAVRRRGRAA